MTLIASSTRIPGRLQELFSALDHDPVLVRECLVRPVLVDRTARQLFSSDRRIHADTRRQAETLRARLAAGEIDRTDAHAARDIVHLVRGEQGPEATTGVALSPDEFERYRERLATAPGGVGSVVE